jgi:hypothetical protein
MSIFTGRELEFLASLRTSWRRLYCNELARLLKEGDNPCDARPEAHSIAPQSGRSKGFVPNQAAAKSWRPRHNTANATKT